MPVDIKNILTALQKKANNVNSNTDPIDIVNILKAIKKADGATLAVYDSDGTLPDAATSNQALGYVKSTGKLKINNGRWDEVGQGKGVPQERVGFQFTYQGSTYGYGYNGITSSPSINGEIIDRWSLVSDGNATKVADITLGPSFYGEGIHSSNAGYSLTGPAGNYPWPEGPNGLSSKFKYPFADETAIEFLSGLTTPGQIGGGSTATEGVSAYILSGGIGLTTIQKFPYSNDTADTTDVGDVTVGRYNGEGLSSPTHGYMVGGRNPSAVNTIDKFPFAVGGTATDVGDMVVARYSAMGTNSEENGYSSGGYPDNDDREKFSFTSDGNAALTGGLHPPSAGRANGAGVSSVDAGYVAGGFNSPAYFNNIDKFPWANDTANATDVGDLTVARYGVTGASV